MYQIDDVLRKLGITADQHNKRLWARCPRADDRRYHTTGDKNPTNWFIWSNDAGPDKAGKHHCFSCKFGGGLVDLVIHSLKLKSDFSQEDWQKAKAWLNSEIVEVEAPSAVNLHVSSVYGEQFNVPSEVIFEPVSEWPSPMRNYLVKERHMPEWQINRWGIGYAVDGRLSGRVVLITRDQDKTPVNYHARSIGSGKRYLMPKKAESPDLRVLFGEEHWDGRICVGALSGSHVHPETVSRIVNFDRVAIVTDNDVAGKGAREKLIAALSRHIEIKNIELPSGEDADSVEQSDLQEFMKEALPEENKRVLFLSEGAFNALAMERAIKAVTKRRRKR